MPSKPRGPDWREEREELKGRRRSDETCVVGLCTKRVTRSDDVEEEEEAMVTRDGREWE